MVVEDPDTPGNGIPQIKALRAARQRRRVSDDIFQAFHFACETKNLDVAARLLGVLENLLVGRVDEPESARGRELAPLHAARDRLTALRRRPE